MPTVGSPLPAAGRKQQPNVTVVGVSCSSLPRVVAVTPGSLSRKDCRPRLVTSFSAHGRGVVCLRVLLHVSHRRRRRGYCLALPFVTSKKFQLIALLLPPLPIPYRLPAR